MTFTKSDLKTGMVLKLHDGEIVMVLKDTNNGDIVSGQTWMPLSAFRDDLTYRHTCEADSDIVQVYQPGTNAEYLGNGLCIGQSSLIWQRTEKSPAQIKLEQLEAEQRTLADKIAEVRRGL